MLNQVADGVWVRPSEWVWSNAIAVRGDGGLILVNPGPGRPTAAGEGGFASWLLRGIEQATFEDQGHGTRLTALRL
jgi:hypothetical protein